MRKGEKLAGQASSKDSMTLRKSAASSSESDSDRFLFFLFKDAISTVYFSLSVLGMYQGGNLFGLVETGIHNQYTRAESRFSSRCQLHVLSTSQSPILSTQLTLSHLLLAPKRSYLPTPPLGQDMTQGEFLSGV